MHRFRLATFLVLILGTLALPSCGLFHSPSGPQVGPGGVPMGIAAPPPNPIQVGDQDPVFLWNQVVDTVDDYFRVQNEQAVQKNGNQWLEGRLVTYEEIGATCLEPWRGDTVGSYERLQSTFQTIQRVCTVTAIPNQAGYLIEVRVEKSLEDVDRSQFAAEGASSTRHDGTIVRGENQLRGLPITLGWIPLGRDMNLEQKILSEIAGRVTNVSPPRRQLFDFMHHE